jgi:hypothetical protein
VLRPMKFSARDLGFNGQRPTNTGQCSFYDCKKAWVVQCRLSMPASHHVLQQLVRGYATRAPPRGRLGATLSLDHVSSCSDVKLHCQFGLQVKF